jgi:Xaa-Pro dipeptidase
MLFAGLDLARVRATLVEQRLDGWLLFDFRGINPILSRLLGDIGFSSRRLFVLIPRQGEPTALVHKIELGAFAPGQFPGKVVGYARWEELHAGLTDLVKGMKLAMEISPEDAVPYLDRVPLGVVELVRRLGGTVTGSAALVTRFASAWNADELAGHIQAAEALAEIANEALRFAVTQGGSGLTESQLQRRVVDAIHARPALRAGAGQGPRVGQGPGGPARPVGRFPPGDGLRGPDLDGLLGPPGTGEGGGGLAGGSGRTRRGDRRGEAEGGEGAAVRL